MYKNEKYEWMDFWWDNADAEGKRVLLIGDSISRDGYYHIVKERLDGKYLVDRCSISTGVDNPAIYKAIDLFIKDSAFKYDYIHFNNGLHACYIPEGEFGAHFERVARYIIETAPESKLILGLCTPYRINPDESGFGDFNSEVIKRNEEIKKVGEKLGIKVNDLYSCIVDGGIMTYDGLHYKEDGWIALGNMVADSIIND